MDHWGLNEIHTPWKEYSASTSLSHIPLHIIESALFPNFDVVYFEMCPHSWRF